MKFWEVLKGETKPLSFRTTNILPGFTLFLCSFSLYYRHGPSLYFLVGSFRSRNDNRHKYPTPTPPPIRTLSQMERPGVGGVDIYTPLPPSSVSGPRI